MLLVNSFLLSPPLQVLDREGQMDNPCTSWLADAYWDNITELDKLTNFHGLMNSFEQYPRDWHLWYTNATPEKAMLPGAQTSKPVSPTFLRPFIQLICLPLYSSSLLPSSPQGTCLLAKHSLKVPLCLDSLLFQTLPATTRLISR